MTPDPTNGRPLHDRLLVYLDSPDGKKLLKHLAAAVIFLLAQRKVVAVVAALSVGSGVVGANLAGVSGGSAPKPAPIKQAWLAQAGPFKIERVHVPCPGVDVNLGAPAKGVGHTTEGGWAGAMSVFRRHYAPHFMVGRDNGRVRVVQFCPLGEISAALKNRAGGVATNHDARAQVEIVGFSQRAPWQPDAGVLKAYAALLYALRDAAGIPLVHVPNPSRSSAVWLRASGWFDHAGVPENDHWDMGSFRWSAAITQATGFAPVLNPGHKPPVTPIVARARYRVCYWKRGLPKAVCLDVPYASLRQLKATQQRKPVAAGGSVGTVMQPG